MSKINHQMRGRKEVQKRLQGLEVMVYKYPVHYAWIAALRWVLCLDEADDAFPNLHPGDTNHV